MKFNPMSIFKKISNLPDVMRFKKLKERSTSPDFTEFSELAECYHKGTGIRRNYKLALKWYIKEAETGNAEAQYVLGMRYWKGEKLVGGEKNEEEALHWIGLAADQDYKKAVDFMDQNIVCDPVKLQEKIDNFRFGKIGRTINFIKTIKDLNQREEFIHKAIEYYQETSGTQDVLSLLDYSCDMDYKVYVLLRNNSSLDAQNLLKKYETETSDKKRFTLILAKTNEKLGMFDKAYDYYKLASDAKEFAGFLCRWSKVLFNDDKLLEAYEKIEEAIAQDKDSAIQFSKIMAAAINSKYGENAYDLIGRIRDAEDIGILSQLEEKVSGIGLLDIYNERMVALIRKEMASCDTLEKLSKWEDSIKKVGLEPEYNQKKEAIIKEAIDSCKNVEELATLKDMATNNNFEKCYDEKYEELSENIEEEIENAWSFESLAELEEKAYKRDCVNLFLQKLLELIGKSYWRKYVHHYNDFQEYDSKELLIDNIAVGINKDIDDFREKFQYSVPSTWEFSLEDAEIVWEDLPIDTCDEIEFVRCCQALYRDKDLEEALDIYYSSSANWDDHWSEYLEEGMAELYYKDQKYYSIVELVEKYGDPDADSFLDVDLGPAYLEEGKKMEKEEDFEKAIEYYEIAANKYGAAATEAQARLSKLRKE